MSGQYPKKVNPLTDRECKFLFLLRNGPQSRPDGIGPATINKLTSRKLIVRTERLQNYGPEIYVLTELGRAFVSNATGKVQTETPPACSSALN